MVEPSNVDLTMILSLSFTEEPKAHLVQSNFFLETGGPTKSTASQALDQSNSFLDKGRKDEFDDYFANDEEEDDKV
jgi:hypothetical protein